MSGRFDTPLRSGQRGGRVVRQRVKTDDGQGHKWITVGTEDYTYEVNIDWKDVAAMAAKAADNSGNQSHAGPIQVKITARKMR